MPFILMVRALQNRRDTERQETAHNMMVVLVGYMEGVSIALTLFVGYFWLAQALS